MQQVQHQDQPKQNHREMDDKEKERKIRKLFNLPANTQDDAGKVYDTREYDSVKSFKNFKKIHVKTPIVEMDGDEMTRVMWQIIKQKLIYPFLDMRVEYYDLSLKNRDATDCQVTFDSAQAIKKWGVGIKCATITPDEDRMIREEFTLPLMEKSPNGWIREILNGTIFQEPIVFKNIPKIIPQWKDKIIILRHAFGGVHMSNDFETKEAGTFEMEFVPNDGSETQKFVIAEYPEDGGVGLCWFNTRDSITKFAKASFECALKEKVPLYMTTKNTIMKTYDGMFKDIFEEMYVKSYKKKFEDIGQWYEHRLIDDMVAYCLKSNGGYVWACKNYDGDVQSDVIAQGFGSQALLSSVLQCPDGSIEAEAYHGTDTEMYSRHQKGEETSCNSIASIFAWTKGLWHRGEKDGNQKLQDFCKTLEKACIKTVEDGKMTKDLASLVNKLPENELSRNSWRNTQEFIHDIEETLLGMLGIEE